MQVSQGIQVTPGVMSRMKDMEVRNRDAIKKGNTGLNDLSDDDSWSWKEREEENGEIQVYRG